MNSDNTTFRDKKCVVTGGTGFIGSHLCSYLEEQGAEVWNIDIEEPIKGTLFHIINEGKAINVLVEDLSRPESITEVKKIEPDIIFHLASEPYAPFTSNSPNCAFQANVVTTANMLEAARQIERCSLVLASSACVFGATNISPLTFASEVTKPEHYYSYTKRLAEMLVNSYAEHYGVDTSICRFSNVYGPGDRHFGRIVPSVCRQLVYDNPKSINLFRSTGESIFEFLYIGDAIDGLCSVGRLAGVTKSEKVYHFSGGSYGRSTIHNLVKTLSQAYDSKFREICCRIATPEKTVTKYLDFEKSTKELKWAPKIELWNGLFETVSWYKKNLKWLSGK
jgi:nucleoside-diphosphate-sugar epimerase